MGTRTVVAEPHLLPESRLLSEQDWRERGRAHRERARNLTAAHRERKQRGEKHPVEDFLWTYYSVKPAELEKWHVGAGVALQNAAVDRRHWKYYLSRDGDVEVDLDAFFSRRGSTADYIERLFEATIAATPSYGCFGLHEWAMVYKSAPSDLRHVGLPLRIGHEATDAVVASHRIICSHFDAYRFFTREAAPLNQLRPTRETQPQDEQAGCLHAGMDVYKWVSKLGPIIPGELLLDAFELARDIREVDMRASPYDVSGYVSASGQPLRAIPIETASGKQEYANLQRGFAERGNALRERALHAIHLARTSHAK